MRREHVEPAAATGPERRVARVAIVATALVFAAALLLAGPRFHGFDDAKYLGIGLNLLAGRGPLTSFGVFFEPHSPLWPVVIAAPRFWFGLDPYAFAHLLNVVAAAAVVALGAAIGWRIRPAAGALAAIGIVAFPYVLDLSRRVGLDMPSAALALAWLVAGGIAVRRGTTGSAVVAGAIFAIAALTKESVLPFAPVPFLAGLAAGRAPMSVARSAAVVLAVAAIGTSWWWIMYGIETGRVYRLGTPAWTLVPLAVGVALLVVAGIAWQRGRRASPLRVSGRTIAWALAAGWIGLEVVFFGGAAELRGRSLLDPGQLRYYAATWFEQLSPVIAVGGVGAIADATGRLAGRRTTDGALEPWLAFACAAPFVLLVAGVGELPRHYVAEIVLLLVVGASGWLWLVETALFHPGRRSVAALILALAAASAVVAPLALGRPVLLVGAAGLGLSALVAAGLILRSDDRRGRLASRLGEGRLAALVVAVALVAGVGTLAVRMGEGGPAARLDAARAAAVSTVTAWVRATVPAGSGIAFGQSLSQEMAVELQPAYRTVQVRERRDLVLEPAAPLGIGDTRGDRADDWVAIAASPGTAAGFVGYRAADLTADLRQKGVEVWIHAMATDFAEPLVVDRTLTPEHGFRRLASWSWSTASGTLDVLAFGVDANSVAFDRTVWISEDALARLVAGLEAAGAAGRPAAANLLPRVAVVPEGPLADALRGRLARIAG